MQPDPTTAADLENLSKAKFAWKTGGDIDSVEDLFDDELIFVHLNGHVTTKKAWIAEMRSRRFVYRRIAPREMVARLYDGAGVVFGKARFDVTMNGYSGSYDLAFTEVYVRKQDGWKLVNLHTCAC
jgi:hypothetical protein